MIAQYARQAALVVKVIPLIEKEDAFALKGGTAINLFELDMPRLSVDIDLTFTRITDRETAITEINAALERISKDMTRHGLPNRLSGSNVSRKIVCATQDASIKIEPNFILRGTVFNVRKLSASPRTQALFGQAKINVLSRAELYGGKFCAALDRQHPRDLFDVAQFYRTSTITDEIKRNWQFRPSFARRCGPCRPARKHGDRCSRPPRRFRRIPRLLRKSRSETQPPSPRDTDSHTVPASS